MIKAGKSWSSLVRWDGWFCLYNLEPLVTWRKAGGSIQNLSQVSAMDDRFGDLRISDMAFLDKLRTRGFSRWHICYLPFPWCLGLKWSDIPFQGAMISLYLLHVEMINWIFFRWVETILTIAYIGAAKTGVSSHWWSRNSRTGNWSITWNRMILSLANGNFLLTYIWEVLEPCFFFQSVFPWLFNDRILIMVYYNPHING